MRSLLQVERVASAAAALSLLLCCELQARTVDVVAHSVRAGQRLTLRGRGAAIAADCVLTAFHVVEHSTRITVGGRPARVALRDPGRDLVLLAVDTDGWEITPPGVFDPKESLEIDGETLRGVYALAQHRGRWQALLRVASSAGSGTPLLQGGRVVGVILASKQSHRYAVMFRRE